MRRAMPRSSLRLSARAPHVITAVYSGDLNYVGSTSSTVNVCHRQQPPRPDRHVAPAVWLPRPGDHAGPHLQRGPRSRPRPEPRQLSNRPAGTLVETSRATDRRPRRPLRCRVEDGHSLASQAVEHPPVVSAHCQRYRFRRAHRCHGGAARCGWARQVLGGTTWPLSTGARWQGRISQGAPGLILHDTNQSQLPMIEFSRPRDLLMGRFVLIIGNRTRGTRMATQAGIGAGARRDRRRLGKLQAPAPG